ncbi:uncharacterized protein LOC132757643 [Ruditapes philippinarum]|uniref:uncharacterized protein LOC132757643 n=1 Tax=Ruditapes philippinarum TaxID=129788 RepID=UPI00295C1323|nr:uncharacterized protein LOC132757643 [Ruditapes philippinarum]
MQTDLVYQKDMGMRKRRLSNRFILLTILCILCMLTLTLRIVHNEKLDITVDRALVHNPGGCEDTDYDDGNIDKKMLSVLKERNALSKLLNEKQQRVGQLQCEKTNTSSETGGWCMEQSKATGGKHMTDRNLVPTLAQFFKGKYVASFGDGPGMYKKLIMKSGQVKGYDAYDGAPFCDVTSNGKVRFLDLSLPQYGLPLYDWIMSIEVAEHIPRRFENVFIDNVVRHAREGVILSWGKLLQGGYLHVNNRPIEHVQKLMHLKGFIHDKLASNKLQSAATFRFLKANLNVYRRNNSKSHKDLMLHT